MKSFHLRFVLRNVFGNVWGTISEAGMSVTLTACGGNQSVKAFHLFHVIWLCDDVNSLHLTLNFRNFCQIFNFLEFAEHLKIKELKNIHEFGK